MSKKQKLELTWIGKDVRPKLEPRILLEKPELSFHAETRVSENDIFDNILIHGDNLLALKALEQEYAGKVKCIYIDPPYNTGSAFEHYDDGIEHSLWLGLMRTRLEILKNLLSVDGTIWIQIDDEEQAYLKVLCDEVFSRRNFINMVSVNMKNIAGASGGGEDKRLKKNCEYILAYAKDYSLLPLFNGPYTYVEMSELIQQYLDEDRSWKYTTVLIDEGTKEYIGSTVDGGGNEIKVYARKNVVTKSINQLAKIEKIEIKDAYKKYGINVFRTTNSQSSIRTRIIDYRREEGITDNILSIEYIPKTGKNKGIVYEQFYIDSGCNLFVWLRDTSEIIDGELYKKELQGTYWDMNAWMKNVTREGSVTFPNGKKPEALVSRIFDMATNPGDLVLDSFLGSGTTAAVAQKMGRRWIGIELGEHCYTHCVPRLQKVVKGDDPGGITKAVNWQGGGGFRFYELGPSLIREDAWGNPVINQDFNPEMLAEALCKLENFTYAPSPETFWIHGQSSETDFIYVTTQFLTQDMLTHIAAELGEKRSLLICCAAHSVNASAFPNITIKKIPKAVLEKCEWGKDDYSLAVENLPQASPAQTAPVQAIPVPAPAKAAKKSASTGQASLLDLTRGEQS